MYKRIYYIFLLILLVLNGQTQITSLQFDKDLVAYHGIKNPITILMEMVPCDSIFVVSKNGTITADSVNSCHYQYETQAFPRDTILIYKIVKNDTLLIALEKVKTKPLPLIARLGFATNGSMIDKNYLLDFPRGFYISPVNTGLNLNFTIESFLIEVRRKCELTFSKEFLRGSDFSELIAEFEKLQKYDEVLFYDMKYIAGDNKTFTDAYMKLTIK